MKRGDIYFVVPPRAFGKPRPAVVVRSPLNRIVEDWHKYLGDAALATAILDRLLHRRVLVEFRGRSYRLKEAASRLVKGNQSEQQSSHSCPRTWGNLTWPQMGEFQVAAGGRYVNLCIATLCRRSALGAVRVSYLNGSRRSRTGRRISNP